MPLPVSFFQQSIYDNTLKQNGSPESASWEVPITTLTAANYVAKAALLVNLGASVAGLILGNLHQETTTIQRSLISDAPAASSLAQRENKLLCRYHDVATLEKFRVSIPTFDLTTLMANSEFVDLTVGPGLTFKTDFEAIVVSPSNSADAVILDSCQFVGRNT
jgi:hypothetical protein